MIESSKAKPTVAVEDELLKMGNQVEQTMRTAIQALQDRDIELARQVIEQDDLVDNMQIVIEEKLERIVSQVPPVGFELRRNFTMIKIVNDLERIGDYATNIAEVVLELKDAEHIKPLIHIPQLASLATNMVSTVLKAFIEEDVDLAEAVCRKDEEADNLYGYICKELLTIMGDSLSPQVALQGSLLLSIAEWLERTADHATNIGEEIIYINTGKRVKY